MTMTMAKTDRETRDRDMEFVCNEDSILYILTDDTVHRSILPLPLPSFLPYVSA